jgi:hypothetical protein
MQSNRGRATRTGNPKSTVGEAGRSASLPSAEEPPNVLITVRKLKMDSPGYKPVEGYIVTPYILRGRKKLPPESAPSPEHVYDNERQLWINKKSGEPLVTSMRSQVKTTQFGETTITETREGADLDGSDSWLDEATVGRGISRSAGSKSRGDHAGHHAIRQQ